MIENLQERILACARVLLLEQGIDGLNIRAVASACGVAVGMVYNYYGSKDQLIASIMLQDWLQNMLDMVYFLSERFARDSWSHLLYSWGRRLFRSPHLTYTLY